MAKLEHLVGLGITAIQIMPLADFYGKFNWGYDGALWFAPDSSYGRPEDLKAFIDAAHRKSLMVFLDVVYNHFGPHGNYLPAIAPIFTKKRTRLSTSTVRARPWSASLSLRVRFTG
jgi:maltooligosyltrehalose trehalohydrolase